MTLGKNLSHGNGSFVRDPKASVPKAEMPFAMGFGSDDGLHVPNQNVPMPGVGSGPLGMAMRTYSAPPASGKEWSSYGFKEMCQGSGLGEWNRQDEAYFDPSRPKEMALGFSREDVEYAKFSEKKNHEIEKNMTERQRRLLKALEKGQLFKLSRLVPC